jgi:hypothetical protein
MPSCMEWSRSTSNLELLLTEGLYLYNFHSLFTHSSLRCFGIIVELTTSRT